MGEQKRIPINESAIKGTAIRGMVACPACGTVGMYVYDDANGDLNYKCPICHRKSIVHLDDLSVTLLDKDMGAVNESFLGGKAVHKIKCDSCKRLAAYAYDGASGHINLRCMHKKCHEKLVIELDTFSSCPLNKEQGWKQKTEYS